MYASRLPTTTGRIRLRSDQIRNADRNRPATTARDLKNVLEEAPLALEVIRGARGRLIFAEVLGFQEEL